MSKKIQEAIVAYLDGNKNAINEIYEIYTKKFQYVNATRNNDGSAFSDLNICLTTALNTYDIAKNVQFNTWFWKIYRNHCGAEINRWKAKKKHTWDMQTINTQSIHQKLTQDEKLEIGDTIKDKRNDIEEKTRQIDFYAFLDSHDIKDRERKVIEGLYFGKSQTDIAKENNVSVPAIHFIVKGIKDRPYAEKLYELLKSGVMK